MLVDCSALLCQSYEGTQASNLSDALHVQRECGVKSQLRVAPLFETLDDLEEAELTMRNLFSNSWYLNHINGTQVSHSEALPVEV